MNFKEVQTISLEIISPVAVTNGEELSPIADFDINNGYLYHIDKATMEEWFKRDPKLMEKYLQEVWSVAADNQQNQAHFFESMFGDQRHQLYKSKTGIKSFLGKENPHNVKTIYKTPEGKPYIPGSTLKGAINHGLFFHWLDTTEAGRKACQSLLESIHHKGEKGILKVFGQIEKQFFGFLNQAYKLASSLLRIQDSKTFQTDSLGVIAIDRKNIKNQANNIDKVLQTEAIIPFQPKAPVQSTTGIEFYQDPNFNGSMQLSAEKGWLQDIFNRLNHTSLTIVQHEKDIAHKEQNLQKLKGVYEQLEADIKEAQKQQSCYLPIGFDKSYLNNSVGLVIKEKDPEAYQKLYSKLKLGKKGQKIFPVTRTLTELEGNAYPMGWIKIKN